MGIKARIAVLVVASSLTSLLAVPANASQDSVTNHGGPVQTAPNVYVVFWGWATDPAGEASYLVNFLSSVGGNTWLNTVVVRWCDTHC